MSFANLSFELTSLLGLVEKITMTASQSNSYSNTNGETTSSRMDLSIKLH